MSYLIGIPLVGVALVVASLGIMWMCKKGWPMLIFASLVILAFIVIIGGELGKTILGN